MTTVLILTVGGSHQPLLTSIQQHRPDRVHFLCSGDSERTKGSYQQVIGEGNVLKSRFDLPGPDLPNLVTLAQLSRDQYEVHKIANFDDLNDCYLAATRVLEEARKEPAARLIADYTGGTKSMTAGLAAAALDDGCCEIALVVGHRADLIKVKDQTQYVLPVQVWDAQLHRRLRVVREMVARFDYAAAEEVLRAAAARFASPSTREQVQKAIGLCRAFDAWDRFDHARARDSLQPYQGEFVDYWRVLRVLAGESTGHGFEPIEDLLHNADRRFRQGRFDDAVARIYRALEWTAQIWLRERHQIETGNVEVTRVPESERPRLEAQRKSAAKGKPGKIEIGLREAWELIAAFPDDPMGLHYSPRRSALLNFLTLRNASILAHGFRPVRQEEYLVEAPTWIEFMRKGIELGLAALGRKRQVTLPQFPADLLPAS